ncbi:MAG TPA: copper transporter [Solirubrobacterales bacterium]
MGYSARYHAFSIIAIFTALAIGIVIGAGFGQDLVSDASEDLEQSLSSDLEEESARSDELAAELDRERAFGIRLYPPLVDSRLRGETIGVIALGDLPEDLAREIEETIEPTGGELSKVAVVREPPDVEALGDALGPQFENLPVGAAEERLGRLLGAELVEGGRLVDRSRDELLDRFSGNPGPVDNVILVKAPAEDAVEEDQKAVEGFEEAIIEGIRGTEVPAVAVELSRSEPSNVPLFDSLAISTVDSLDLTSGKVSAVFALLGSEGNYGIKETADRPLPDLVFPAPNQGRPAEGRGLPEGQGRGGN